MMNGNISIGQQSQNAKNNFTNQSFENLSDYSFDCQNWQEIDSQRSLQLDNQQKIKQQNKTFANGFVDIPITYTIDNNNQILSFRGDQKDIIHEESKQKYVNLKKPHPQNLLKLSESSKRIILNNDTIKQQHQQEEEKKSYEIDQEKNTISQNQKNIIPIQNSARQNQQNIIQQPKQQQIIQQTIIQPSNQQDQDVAPMIDLEEESKQNSLIDQNRRINSNNNPNQRYSAMPIIFGQQNAKVLDSPTFNSSFSPFKEEQKTPLLQQQQQQNNSILQQNSDENIFEVECEICHKLISIDELDSHEQQCQVKSDERFIQNQLRSEDILNSTPNRYQQQSPNNSNLYNQFQNNDDMGRESVSRRLLNLGDIHSSRSNFRYNNTDNNRYSNVQIDNQNLSIQQTSSHHYQQQTINNESFQQQTINTMQQIQSLLRQATGGTQQQNSQNSRTLVQQQPLQHHNTITQFRNFNQPNPIISNSINNSILSNNFSSSLTSAIMQVETDQIQNTLIQEDQGGERISDLSRHNTNNLSNTNNTINQIITNNINNQRMQFERSTRPPNQPLQNPSAVPSTFNFDENRNLESTSTVVNGRYNLQLNDDLREYSDNEESQSHGIQFVQRNTSNNSNLSIRFQRQQQHQNRSGSSSSSSNRISNRSSNSSDSKYHHDNNDDEVDNSHTYNVGLYDDHEMPGYNSPTNECRINFHYDQLSFESRSHNTNNNNNLPDIDLNMHSFTSATRNNVATNNRNQQRDRVENQYFQLEELNYNNDDEYEFNANSNRSFGILIQEERKQMPQQLLNNLRISSPLRFSAGGFRGIRELINDRQSKSTSPNINNMSIASSQNSSENRDQILNQNENSQERRLQELHMFRAGLFDINEEDDDSINLTGRIQQRLNHLQANRNNINSNQSNNNNRQNSLNNIRHQILLPPLPPQSQTFHNHLSDDYSSDELREEVKVSDQLISDYVADEIDAIDRGLRNLNSRVSNVRLQRNNINSINDNIRGRLGVFNRLSDDLNDNHSDNQDDSVPPLNDRNLFRRFAFEQRLRMPNDSMDDYLDQHSRGSDDIIEESRFDDYEALINLDEDVVQAVPKKLIDQLPTSKFTESNKQNFSEENKSCTICMCQYEIEEVYMILPCLHRFHSECIKEWFNRRNTCPNCKDRVCDHFEEEMRSIRQPRATQFLNLINNSLGRINHANHNSSHEMSQEYEDFHIRFSNDNSSLPSMNMGRVRRFGRGRRQNVNNMPIRQIRERNNIENSLLSNIALNMNDRPRGYFFQDYMRQERANVNQYQNLFLSDDDQDSDVEEENAQPSLIANQNQIPQSDFLNSQNELNQMLLNLRMGLSNVDNNINNNVHIVEVDSDIDSENSGEQIRLEQIAEENLESQEESNPNLSNRNN